MVVSICLDCWESEEWCGGKTRRLSWEICIRSERGEEARIGGMDG